LRRGQSMRRERYRRKLGFIYPASEGSLHLTAERDMYDGFLDLKTCISSLSSFSFILGV
jgi:hypothetical protein